MLNQYFFFAIAASGKTTDQGQGPRDQGNQGQQDRRNNQGYFKNFIFHIYKKIEKILNLL